MKTETHEAEGFSKEKPVYYFRFEPDLGEQNRPEHEFVANDFTDAFSLAVEAWMDGMCETHILANVGKHG